MTVDLDRPRRHIKTLRRLVPAGRRDGDDLKISAMANSSTVRKNDHFLNAASQGFRSEPPYPPHQTALTFMP